VEKIETHISFFILFSEDRALHEYEENIVHPATDNITDDERCNLYAAQIRQE
jgi:hypothetical protein